MDSVHFACLAGAAIWHTRANLEHIRTQTNSRTFGSNHTGSHAGQPMTIEESKRLLNETTHYLYQLHFCIATAAERAPPGVFDSRDRRENQASYYPILPT